MPNVVGEHRDFLSASRDRYSRTALTSLQLRVLMEISGDCLIISTRVSKKEPSKVTCNEIWAIEITGDVLSRSANRRPALRTFIFVWLSA